MKRATDKQDSLQCEMASMGGTSHDGKVGLEMSSSGKGNDVEIRPFKKGYLEDVCEVVANANNGLQEEPKPTERGPEAVNESLTAITLTTQQQMLSIRRKMCLMTLLLVIFFLTAAASLALAVLTMLGKTSSLSQPTSSVPGTFHPGGTVGPPSLPSSPPFPPWIVRIG